MLPTIIILGILIAILASFAIVYICIYNSLQKNFIRIQEAESEIDDTLRKRYDILVQIESYINELVYEHIEKIVKLYAEFEKSPYSKIIRTEDFMMMKFTTKQAYQCDFAITNDRLDKFRTGKLYHSLSHGGRLSEDQINLLLRSGEEELDDAEKANINKHNII